MRTATAISLSDEERSALEALALGRRTEVRVSERAKIVLRAAAGLQNTQIATNWELIVRPVLVGVRATWPGA